MLMLRMKKCWQPNGITIYPVQEIRKQIEQIKKENKGNYIENNKI